MKRARHLPLLLNPFINALFNHPCPNDSQLKNIIHQLAAKPEDYILFVPITSFLLLNNDSETGENYRNLCYRYDFLQCHIVKSTDFISENKRKILKTLNGKEIILENNTLTCSKGFNKNNKANIVGSELFQSFASYIPFGSNFEIIYIDVSLIGTPKINNHYSTTSESSPFDKIESTKDKNNLTLFDDTLNDDEDDCNDNNDINSKDKIEFVDLLREFPLLLSHTGDDFKKLFKKFTLKSNCSDKKIILNLFTDVLSIGYKILQQIPKDIMKSINLKYPNLYIQKLFYTYFELNIYDKLWPIYINSPKSDSDLLLNSAYDGICLISINQSGIHEQNPKRQSILEKKCQLGISEFKKLTFSNSSSEKCEILINTFQILSKKIINKDFNEQIVINADTLIPLLIFVICHSKVKNLNKHLDYIKNFYFSDVKLSKGFLGYIISTFDAVLNYFNKENINQLISFGIENQLIWNTIDSCDYEKIDQLLNDYNENLKEIKSDSFIRCRNFPNGASILMYSLRKIINCENYELQNKINFFTYLLSFENIFNLDDILDDISTDEMETLLIASLKIEPMENIENNIPNLLLQILLNSDTSEKEIENFICQRDIHQKHLGHYITQYPSLLPLIGKYIDWKQKDSAGQPAYLSALRSYDMKDYNSFIVEVTKSVIDWCIRKNEWFDDKDMLDSKGNTIWHAVRDPSTLDLLLKCFNRNNKIFNKSKININRTNNAMLTPLMQYIKFNRLENVKLIINDERLKLMLADEKYHLTASDYIKVERLARNWTEESENQIMSSSTLDEQVNYNIMNLIDNALVDLLATDVENKGSAFSRMKYNSERCIVLHIHNIITNPDGEVFLTNNKHTLEEFKKVAKLLKLEFPFSFIGNDINLNSWFPNTREISNKVNVSYFNKNRLNMLLFSLNIFLKMYMSNHTTQQSELLWEFLVMSKKLNELESIKRINNKMENLKENLCPTGEIFVLKPDDILSMQNFLKYSTKEISNFAQLLDRLYRLSIFHEKKSNNYLYVWCNMQEFGGFTENGSMYKAFSPIVNFFQYVQSEAQKNDNLENNYFNEHIRLLKLSVEELVNQINNFAEKKMTRWWFLYGELQKIKQGFTQYKTDGGIDLTKFGIVEDESNNDTNDKTSVLDRILKEVEFLLGSMDEKKLKSLIDRTTMYSQNDKLTKAAADSIKKMSESFDKTNTSSSYLPFLNSKKYSSFEELVKFLSDYEKEFSYLNVQIKLDYESIAVEISNFYEFKRTFLKSAFKRYSQMRIEMLKEQSVILQTVHSNS
ncbi:hypothetical protein B5S28_g3759 [[Candida] boidinii]|nr:hypothetical protein B5S28_g3759 [[Candida] boidinii]